MATAAADLVAIEARLRAILAPYADRLDLASKHVGFYLLPMPTHPDLREGLSPALAKRLTGTSVFTFLGVVEALFAELEAVVARAFERSMDGP